MCRFLRNYLQKILGLKLFAQIFLQIFVQIFGEKNVCGKMCKKISANFLWILPLLVLSTAQPFWLSLATSQNIFMMKRWGFFQALCPFYFYFWSSRIPKTVSSENVTEPSKTLGKPKCTHSIFFIFGPIRRIWFLLFLPNVKSLTRSLRLVLTLSTSAQRGWSAGF